jgi:hypothetical protein
MSSKHHDIEITRNGNVVSPPKSMPDVRVGDTVRYVFKGTERVTITFPQLSPFQTDQQINTQVHSGETSTAVREGSFQSGCSITLPDGKSIGWDAVTNPPESGGEIKIKR